MKKEYNPTLEEYKKDHFESLDFFYKIFIILKVVQLKFNPCSIFIYRVDTRFNPFNPLSYVVLLVIFIIMFIEFISTSIIDLFSAFKYQ